MTRRSKLRGPRPEPPTWDQFKAEIRKTDRDSLLLRAAAATARIAREDQSAPEAKQGLTPWAVADVARTSLAWGGFERPEADLNTLIRLCNRNVNLADEGLGVDDRLGRHLARLFFEQFPGQRSMLADMSRSLLLFGSAAEYPEGLQPSAMSPGWFESVTEGQSLEEYVEALFFIHMVTQSRDGQFSLEWLDGPAFEGLEEVISFESVRHTFNEYLSTTVKAFKEENRVHQDPVPSEQKKFAFNPLTDRPFITDVSENPLAPCVQAIAAKAFPPAIYHLARPKLSDAFANDLGAVFQHYTGRQLGVITGDRQVLPEVSYGPRRNRVDSCDWFLDLPGVLLLIECKARQPIESLRTGGAEWLNSIEGSINRGIRQLNRSNQDISDISSVCVDIDSSKPRVGLVVTLEPFYLSQNWLVWEHLEEGDIPIGVVSIAELENLVLLTADELAQTLLREAPARGQLMVPNPDPETLRNRVNPLLESTWDSIALINRVRTMADRLVAKRDGTGEVTTTEQLSK